MNFNRGFHYFHHPFWGFSPYFWFNTHIGHTPFRVAFSGEIPTWTAGLLSQGFRKFTSFRPQRNAKHPTFRGPEILWKFRGAVYIPHLPFVPLKNILEGVESRYLIYWLAWEGSRIIQDPNIFWELEDEGMLWKIHSRNAPLLAQMIPIDLYFSDRLKPPTRYVLPRFGCSRECRCLQSTLACLANVDGVDI